MTAVVYGLINVVTCRYSQIYLYFFVQVVGFFLLIVSLADFNNFQLPLFSIFPLKIDRVPRNNFVDMSSSVFSRCEVWSMTFLTLSPYYLKS